MCFQSLASRIWISQTVSHPNTFLVQFYLTLLIEWELVFPKELSHWTAFVLRFFAAIPKPRTKIWVLYLHGAARIFSYHIIRRPGFEPSVEFHQTETFEGRSTVWATEPFCIQLESWSPLFSVVASKSSSKQLPWSSQDLILLKGFGSKFCPAIWSRNIWIKLWTCFFLSFSGQKNVRRTFFTFAFVSLV